MKNTATVQEIRANYKSLLRNKITIQEWWSFIDGIDKEFLKETTAPISNAENRIKNYKNSPLFKNKIRAFCNRFGYSDVFPYEVVRVVSDKCVEVRAMDAVQTVFPKDFRVGGFSAVCVDNHNQDYNYTSNTNNAIKKIRLGKKGWGNGEFVMSDTPIKHYDYNF